MLNIRRLNFRPFLPLLFIVFLSLCIRTLWLDRIPVGVSNDELDYLLNARALFLTGSDISGTWNPFSLTPPESSFPQAEIPSIITALFVGILPLSLFTSKLIYALIGTVTVAAIYGISRRLLGKKEAFVVGIVASINPWLIFFGRTAYDTPIAISGFAVALYILLIAKGWKILLSFPFLFIAFYSYIGTKLILLPFLAITLPYVWIVVNKRKFLRQYLILLSLCTLMVLYFAFGIFTSSHGRISELASPNLPSIIEATNNERQLSIQTPLTNVFSNKIIIFSKESLGKYINAFSPNFLFLHGDSKYLFTLWHHGTFYYIDAIFLLVGLCALFWKNRKLWLFLIGLVLISPIPSVVSNVGVSYAIRSQLLSIIFPLFIGFGIYHTLSLAKNKLYKKLLIAAIILLYGIHFVNFSNIYFFRNPIYNSEAFNLSARVLSKYLSLQSGNDSVFVVTGEPKTPLKHYLFYTNSYNKENYGEVAQMFKSKKYTLENIRFITCSDLDSIPGGSVTIFESGILCKKEIVHEGTPLTIAQLSDSGSIYTIVNDKTCVNYPLRPYPFGVRFSDLRVEELSNEVFCKTFITAN
ncbi:MAG: hypothetical protein WD967_00815 [Candidatus Levyibacteriota bacterium]